MLRIHLFGQLRLFVDGQAWKFTARPKVLPLWAYLMLHRNSPAPRDRLAFALWPDEPEAQARANLRRHLHALARALPPAANDCPWLWADDESVQWNAEAAWLDVAEFERLSADPARLAEAVALYDDDLLRDLYDDWVIRERERLRERYFGALAQLIQQSRRSGDLDTAIRYARLLLQRDPLREETWRELIALRHESGDRTGALQEYQRLEQRLQEELGVAPMPETIRLYEGIRLGQAEWGAEEQEGTRAGGTAPAPPGRAAPRHNLPAQLTSFVGREKELAAIGEMIAGPASSVRLLTLMGPGGAGKTRLALEAAGRLAREAANLARDGVFFVGLSEIAEPGMVAPAVAEVLGLAESGGRSQAETLRDFVRSRQMLLVLDNFEQVVEAGGVVADLLTVAPGLRAIVTSRVPLRVYGEHVLALDALALPDLASLPPLGELAHYAAVALFAERVRAVKADFELTEENVRAVVEICARLDGLPLAIELAAARGRHLTPQGMLGRLTNRLDFLTGGPRNAQARQQTLRQAIEWSFNLLAPDEQALFARLGVFAGPFSAASAAAIAGDCRLESGEQPTAETQSLIFEDRLAGLADQSMLRQETGAADGPVFRLLPTIREYALEQLGQRAELEGIQRRHTGYFLAQAEQAQHELGGPQQPHWLAQLEAEHDDLRSALAWASSHGEAEVCLRLAVALGEFWRLRGHWREGRRWLEAALAGWPDAPVGLRARALEYVGAMTWSLGSYADAQTWFQQALPLWESLGPAGKAGLVSTLNRAGMADLERGALDSALALLERALAAARELDDKVELSRALANTGIVHSARGDYEPAIRCYLESLELDREMDNQVFLGTDLNNLAFVSYRVGRYAEAGEWLAESLQLLQQVGHRHNVAIALNNLASVSRVQGDLEAGRVYAAQSLKLYEDLGHQDGARWPLHTLGAIAHGQGDLGLARSYFEKSLALWHSRDDRRGVPGCLDGLAAVDAAEGQANRAARLLSAATALRPALGVPPRWVPEQADHDRTLDQIRASLTPAELEAAWQAGSELSLDEAVALALGRRQGVSQ